MASRNIPLDWPTTVGEATRRDPIAFGNLKPRTAVYEVEVNMRGSFAWKMLSRFAVENYREGFPDHINANQVFEELQRQPQFPPIRYLEEQPLYQEVKRLNSDFKLPYH